MTMTEVRNRLVFEMIQLTGHFEDQEIYQIYIQRALVIGMEHFNPDQEELIALNDNGVEVARYRSVTEASKKLGVTRQSIDKVLSGINHSAKGHSFRKANINTSINTDS